MTTIHCRVPCEFNNHGVCTHEHITLIDVPYEGEMCLPGKPESHKLTFAYWGIKIKGSE